MELYIVILLTLIVVLFLGCFARRASMSELSFYLLVEAMGDLLHVLFFFIFIALED